MLFLSKIPIMELILDKLKEIEKENDIEILFAVESGSRAWGFSSPDSDYDIRFVYKNKKNWYLSPWEKKDTIDFFTEQDLDGSGWDLKKTLLLLSKSNTPLLEWINSSTFYFKNEKVLNLIKEIAEDCFSPITSSYHYLSMSKKFLELCNGDEVKLKSYFYCLRTTLANKWIIDKDTFPPVLMADMFELLPDNILVKIQNLITLKSQKDESYLHPQDWEVFQFLEKTILENEEKTKLLRSGNLNKNKAEKIFIKILENDY